MTLFMSEACIEEKLDPIREDIAELQASPILSATKCDGSPIPKDAKLPTCEELAEVKEDITDIRGDILDIKLELIEVKTDILELNRELNDIEASIDGLDVRVDAIEANPVLTIVGCDGLPLPVDTQVPTCEQVATADKELSDRVDVLEANPVLTLVGCDGKVLLADTQIPTCEQVATADKELSDRIDSLETDTGDLEIRVDVLEKNPILTAVGCGGEPLEAGTMIAQCKDIPNLQVFDATTTVDDTRLLQFLGAGVKVSGANPFAAVTIPQTVTYTGPSLATATITNATPLVPAGIPTQPSNTPLETAVFGTLTFVAPSSGYYDVGYTIAASAVGAIGTQAVNATTTLGFRINGGNWNALAGAGFTHPTSTLSGAALIYWGTNYSATRVFITQGTCTLTFSAKTYVMSSLATTHSIVTDASYIYVSKALARSL